MNASFPYTPKSTTHLRPGDFWDIPLEQGGFACGRVVQIEMVKGKRNTVEFLAGLMDWFGEELPTEKSIAGKRIVAQGEVHIKTISESKGKLRGHRSLVLDGLGPWLFRDAEYAKNLQCGFFPLRRYDHDLDSDLPVIGSWGYLHIKDLAEERFRRKRRTKR